VSLGCLSEEFGQQTVQQILQCLYPYQQQGWVEIVAVDSNDQSRDLQGYLRLTDPNGFLFSNTILASLFSYFSDAEIYLQYS
jgi:oxygen-independent coproporphyrinogen-3 oxidase